MKWIYNERRGYWECESCGTPADLFDDPDYPPEWYYCPICGTRTREKTKRQARKCNRCGMYYEFDDLRRITYSYNWHGYSHSLEEYNLCPECDREFRKWVHFYRPVTEEEDDA